VFPGTRGRTSRLPATVKSAELTPALRRKPLLLYGGGYAKVLRIFHYMSSLSIICMRKRAIGDEQSRLEFSHIAYRLFNLIAVFLDSHKNCIYIQMLSKEFREIFIFILIRHVRANKVIVTTNITFCDQQIWCKHGAPRCNA